MPMLRAWEGYVVFSALMAAFIAIVVAWRHHARKDAARFDECFLTGGRDMRTGIVTASLVSLWLWPGTFLAATVAAREFGISGPFWVAVFGAAEILLLTALIQAFRSQGSRARTLPEYLRVRYGRTVHAVALLLVMLTCWYVLLWVGYQGVQVFCVMTGTPMAWVTLAAPLALAAPAAIGGVRGTIVLGWLQALVLGGLTLVLALLLYSREGDVGLYRQLRSAASDADLLSLSEPRAIGSALALMLSTVGLVFTDQMYWQRAVAASPRATGPAFVYSGLTAFAIPLAAGTAFGLSLMGYVPADADVSDMNSVNGILTSFVAARVGHFGLLALLVILITAMLGTCIAELVAISSLVTVDILELQAGLRLTPHRQVRTGRLVMVAAALVCGLVLFACCRAGVGGRWRAEFDTVFGLVRLAAINAAIVPLALGILWRRTSVLGSLGGLLVGTVAGVTLGLATPQASFGPSFHLVEPGPGIAVAAAAIFSSGAVALFGGLVFGHDEPPRVVSLPVHDRTDGTPHHVAAWLIVFVLISAGIAAAMMAGRLDQAMFGIWVTGGLVLLFLTTAYICLMPVREYFEAPVHKTGGTAHYPQCPLPQVRRAEKS